MTPVQTGIAIVIGLGTIGAGSWAGGVTAVGWLDGRYAPLAAVEDLAYSQLKKDLRELRDRIEVAQGQEKRNLEADLAELIDRLCRSYKSDRECQ